MNQFAILMGREFKSRIKKKGYWVFTVLGLVILIGLTFLPSLINMINNQSKATVVIHDPQSFVAPALVAMEHHNSDSSGLKLVLDSSTGFRSMSPAQIKAYMQNKRASLVILVTGPSATMPTFNIEESGSVQPGVVAEVETALQQSVMTARMASLPPSSRALLETPVKIQTHQLQGGSKTEAQLLASKLLVYYLLSILLVTAVVYGQWVAQGLVEEKANRLVEMMLVAVKPWHILFGKIVGIALVGFLQYAIWLGGIWAVMLIHPEFGGLSLQGIPTETIVLLPVFFVVGYLTYAAFYAIAGSLAHRPEDQQMITTPVGLLLAVVFYTTLLGAIPAPDSVFAKVLSFIPVFTPLAMFTRAAESSAPIWQIAAGLSLTIAFNIWLLSYGARVYRRFALRTSGRASWKLLWQKGE